MQASAGSAFTQDHMAGACWPLRAYCEVRAHLAPGEFSAATPAAFHQRHSMKCARIWLAVSRAPRASRAGFAPRRALLAGSFLVCRCDGISQQQSDF
jgi:hypothetical protein